MSTVPPGIIVPWLGGAGYVAEVITGRGTVAAPGWLYCDGRELYQDLYPGLFAAVGTTYGGTSTTFLLPGGARYLVGAPAADAAGAATGAHPHAFTTAVSASFGPAGGHSHPMATSAWGNSGNHGHTTGTNAGYDVTGGPSALAGRATSNTTGAYVAGNDHTHYTQLSSIPAGGDHGHGAVSWTSTTSAAHNHAFFTWGSMNSTVSSTSVHQHPPHIALWHVIKT